MMPFIRGPASGAGMRAGAVANTRAVGATCFSEGITVGFGRTHDRRYPVLLRDLVLSGRARPSVVVTHHGRLDDAPNLYEACDRRADGVIKGLLRP